MPTRATCVVFVLSVLVSLMALQSFGKEPEQLSEDQVLAIIPRSIDMLGADDQPNFEKLVSQGPVIHEALGKELLRLEDWITAGRIIAIFVESKGDKTVAHRYLKRFLELPRPDSWWAPVRAQAANAIRKFEDAQTAQSPTPKEIDVRETMPLPQAPKTPESKTAAPPTTSEEPTSSTPWSIIVVLIVAACGLLWLLLKRRS